MVKWAGGIGLCMILFAKMGLAQDVAEQITFGERRDKDPAVSPDGKYLAFASDRTGSFNIFLMTFGEEGFVQVSRSPKDDRYPSWSPDTNTVYFSSRRTGHGDIYEVARRGDSGFLQLTDSENIEEHPSCGPGGAGLLYTSARKKLIQLRTNPRIIYAEQRGRPGHARVLAEGDEPRFAPDGQTIVFVSRRTKNNDIWLMKADGGRQMQLTTDPEEDENPCFSPDGKQIVFASNRTRNFDIWVMNADGSNPRQLTTDPADETQPCWSLGGHIYFTRDTGDGQSSIYRIKAP